MIVNKKTIDSYQQDQQELQKVIDTFSGFKNIELIDSIEIGTIFQYKIVGRKTLEFCILLSLDGERIADVTNKEIVKDIATFKWSTAKDFSKTLVTCYNWDKLSIFSDGEFKI